MLYKELSYSIIPHYPTSFNHQSNIITMVVTIVSVVIRNSTQKNSELRVRPRKPAVPLSIIGPSSRN